MEKAGIGHVADSAAGRLPADRVCPGACALGTGHSSRLAAQSRVLRRPEPRRVLPPFASAASVYGEAVATNYFHSQLHSQNAREWEAESDSACCSVRASCA